MAEENRDRGYRRILGALFNLGYRIGRGTVAKLDGAKALYAAVNAAYSEEARD